MKTLLDRFNANYESITETGCWLWRLALYHNGYGRFSIGKKRVRAHRTAWELLRGPIPDDKQVLHHCDVRCCVNPDHLYLGTPQDNTDDRITRGRARHNWRLTHEQVRAIRADQRSYSKIAHDYGVLKGVITTIKNNRTYRHVP